MDEYIGKQDATQRKKRIALNIQTMFNGFTCKWFLCFGTLLYYVRRKPKFNIESDIDIGVIGSINNFTKTIEMQYKIDHKIVSDDTGEVLNLCYCDEYNNIFIDIYAWKYFKGMYWHTSDWLMEKPKNGIPSKYTFKSMKKECFDITEKEIEDFQKDLNYGRTMTLFGTWSKPVPEFPNEGILLDVPKGYGYFLDIAYPDWLTERKQSGQSRGFSTLEVNSCKNLC